MGAHDELQELMAHLIRRRRKLTGDPDLEAAIARHVAGSRLQSPAEQLEVYREQFWFRHTAALVEDFPGLGGILGQVDWERLVEEYLETYPPSSFTLRDVGVSLPDHVARSVWLPAHDLCVDMARLEWAYIEIFDAPNAQALDEEKLLSIPEDAWERAVIVLSPALRLLGVRYPVAELRRDLRARPGESVALPEPSRSHLVVYRDANRELGHEEISPEAFALLEALGDGIPLIAACERAALRGPEHADAIAGSLGDWFREWGSRGFIVDVRI